MSFTRRSVALSAALLLAVPLWAAANNVDLTGSLEAFRVVQDSRGQETLVPAETARPQDVIEYRLTYRNTGEDPVRNIFITDPVPAGTTYIIESASEPAEGRVQFSIDGGKTYHPWPIVVTTKAGDGTERYTEATPDMVTHVRWVISETFNPEAAITVSYRTTVK